MFAHSDKERDKLLRRLRRLEAQTTSKPNNALLVQEIGKCHRELDDLPLAEKCFRKACEMDPVDPWSRMYLGNIHYERGEFELALQEFQRASELDLGKGITWVLMGNVFDKLKRYEEAGSYYKKACSLDPQCKVAERNLRRWNKANTSRLSSLIPNSRAQSKPR